MPIINVQMTHEDGGATKEQKEIDIEKKINVNKNKYFR